MKTPTTAPIVSSVSVSANTTYDVAIITLAFPTLDHPEQTTQQAFALPHPAAVSLVQAVMDALDQLRLHNDQSQQDQMH